MFKYYNRIYIAVQYDSEKGLNGWGVKLWDTVRGIKKDLPEVNDEIQKFINSKSEFFKGKDTQSIEWIRSDIIDDAKQLSNVTDELKDDFTNFLETADLSGDVLEQYQQHLKNTGKAVSNFSSFTQKAGNVLKSFGASLLSIGVNWAISQAISLTIKLFDTLSISAEEAIENAKSSKQELDQLTSEISNLNNELETTKNRIEELLEKASSGSISLLEEEELNILKEQNNELQREIELKEKLAEIDAREAADNAAYSLTYRTDDNKWDDEHKATDRIDKLQSYIDSTNYYQEKISEVNKQILDIEKSATDNTYKNDSAYKDLINQQKKFQEELQNTEALISSTYKELSSEDDGLYYNDKIIDGYEELAKRLDTVYMNVELYLNDGNIEDTTEKYIEAIKNKLVENGLSEEISKIVAKGFSDEELESIMNSSSIDWSQCLGLGDATAVIRNIKEQFATINDIELEPQTFSFPTYEEQIDKIQSSLSTLRSALESFNKGELDESAVLDLMQEFPSLVPYIDLAAEGFGNLSEGLSVLIAQQPDSLIQSLQELKASLSTEEEREQVDLLIDQLQRLSSYGDSGIEAYATAIGSTWNDTADVIDGVTTQFENLAKVQEAVSKGLTMSATAAAELAKMYPEILTNAQVTADGQITLNEDVVNSILDGDKSIINAQIAKLEADKAELEAKKAFAEAQLNIVKQVGEGEGSITREVAQYRIDIANQLLQALIEAGMEEDKAYAAVAANMAGNMNEYNRIVAAVARDTSSNMDAAAVFMAETISINSINAQNSFNRLQQKVWDLADAIKAMANGERAGGSGTYGSGGSTSKGGINTTTNSGSFKTATTNYNAQTLSLKDFQSQLELDIKGYTDAIANIDSQIAVLKNLQATFDNNGGIGGHGYADKIKDLEKEKDKINDALKDGAGSLKNEYQELFDVSVKSDAPS